MVRFKKKTLFEYIQGKGKWVRIVKPETYGDTSFWQATIYPSPESLEKVRELQAEGLKNVIKKDEDGYYVKFRCNVNKRRKDGTVWTFTPPEALDSSGRPMDGSLIGNGSDITLKLEIYEHPTPGGGTARAARLVGVKVDNLIEFSPEADYTPEERERVKELADQPPQLWA